MNASSARATTSTRSSAFASRERRSGIGQDRSSEGRATSARLGTSETAAPDNALVARARRAVGTGPATTDGRARVHAPASTAHGWASGAGRAALYAPTTCTAPRAPGGAHASLTARRTVLQVGTAPANAYATRGGATPTAARVTQKSFRSATRTRHVPRRAASPAAATATARRLLDRHCVCACPTTRRVTAASCVRTDAAGTARALTARSGTGRACAHRTSRRRTAARA